jgi:hypothetical protein
LPGKKEFLFLANKQPATQNHRWDTTIERTGNRTRCGFPFTTNTSGVWQCKSNFKSQLS